MALKKSEKKVIPATQAHRNFGDLIRRVFVGHEHIIVEKDGLPVVAIISMQEYENLLKHQETAEREERLREFRGAAKEIGEELERSGLTEEEIEAKVEAVRARLYRENYGE